MEEIWKDIIIEGFDYTKDPNNNNTNIIGKKLPDVNGKIHYICPKEFNGHSIMNFLK